MWIISRIKCDVLKATLGITDDDEWDNRVFFCNEAKALADLAWLKDHNGHVREYMLVADITPPVRKPNRIEIDDLDDELPTYC